MTSRLATPLLCSAPVRGGSPLRRGRTIVFHIALACALAAGLAACGRKGPLDPPPTAAAPAEGTAAVSGQQAAPPPENAATQPPSKRPFLLDPLLN
jgi:predicted small lipoprotein YifL